MMKRTTPTSPSSVTALAVIIATVASALLLNAPLPSNAASLSLRGSASLASSSSSSFSSFSSSSSSLSFTTFPPHANCERAAAMSPLRLSLDPTASGLEPAGDLQRFCFRVTSRSRCEPQAKCCDPSLRSVSKVEFDVVAGCKDSLQRVTVNGQPASYEYDTQLSVLRVVGLEAATTGPDAQICVFLDSSSVCPSLSKLCNRRAGGGAAAAGACRYAIFHANQECCPVSAVPASLPSRTASTSAAATSQQHSTANTATAPVYRSDFPFHQCQRNPAGSRLFATANPNVTVVANDLTRICFDVGLQEVCATPNSQCCDFTLYKMELEVDRTCADALAYTTIDGVQHVRYFQTAPHAAIKIVNLNKAVSAVDGTRVCLFLRPECNSLSKLCAFHDGTCTVGLFSKPGSGAANCCPLSTVSV